MRSVGVSNTQAEAAYSTKYTLTYDDDPRTVAGTVQLTVLRGNRLYSVRDRFDEPVVVGSPRYELYTAAVRKYEDWASKH